jgi:hypothetical protein
MPKLHHTGQERQCNEPSSSAPMSCDSNKSNVEFVLGAIKAALARIDEIRQEMINAGLALRAGYITPQMALDWSEEFAPGCLGFIPPQSGLERASTKHGEGTA